MLGCGELMRIGMRGRRWPSRGQVQSSECLGNLRTNSAPSLVLPRTPMVPPWATIMRRAIASPRPVPFVLVVKKGLKAKRRDSSFSPGPLSRMRTSRASTDSRWQGWHSIWMHSGSVHAARLFSNKLRNSWNPGWAVTAFVLFFWMDVLRSMVFWNKFS